MITEVFTQMDRENIEAYTPKYAVDIILPYISKDKVIWSPFSRDEHNFANYLRELGYKVVNTHIENGQDFLTYTPDFHFDIILDNPPFKNKTKYVERARAMTVQKMEYQFAEIVMERVYQEYLRLTKRLPQ